MYGWELAVAPVQEASGSRLATLASTRKGSMTIHDIRHETSLVSNNFVTRLYSDLRHILWPHPAAGVIFDDIGLLITLPVAQRLHGTLSSSVSNTSP